MINDLPLIGASVWIIVKIMFLVGIAIYVVFAAVVVRQVQLMTDTLEVGFEAPVRLIAIVHLLLSIGVFVLALLTL